MRSRLVVLTIVVLALAALTVWSPLGHKASAVGGPYSNEAFRGTYAVQFSGNVFVAAPYDKFNGPFYYNGLLAADGNGYLDMQVVVANWAGSVSREKITATYSINSDGTFTVTIPNLPVPFAPGVPNVFTFVGVLADGGKIAKIVLSGVSLGGQELPNIGSVITGEFVRQ